jgi:O-antigen/teichoic acid export membrane protein
MKYSQILKYLKDNLYYFFFSFIGNFFVFLYQIFSAKELDVESFGTLVAFNSLLGLICIPAAILQISGVKTFIEILRNKKKLLFINFFFKKFFLINFYFSILYVFTLFFILNFFLDLLKTSSLIEKNIFFLNVLFILISVPFLVYIQSKKNYFVLGLPPFFGSILRFIFLLIFFNFARNYFSGLIANLLSSILVFIFFLFFYKNLIINSNQYKKYFSLKSIFFLYFKNTDISILIVIFSILSLSLDVILFKELFSGDLSGYYSGISMIAKIPTFILSILIIFFYTESLYIREKKINSIVSIFLILICFLVVFIFFFFIFYGKLLLTFLFNDNFSYYYLELAILSVAFTFVGANKILLTILISRNNWKIIIINFAILFLSSFMIFFSKNIFNFCIILLITFFINFLCTIFYFYNS